MKELPKIFADFNNADKQGRVRLNTAGSIQDINEIPNGLSVGMQVIIHDQDSLTTTGVIIFSEEENMWVAEIDWQHLKGGK
jgi:hypothetical protein